MRALVAVVLLAAGAAVLLLLAGGDAGRGRAAPAGPASAAPEEPAGAKEPEQPARPLVHGVCVDEEKRPVKDVAVRARVWDEGYKDAGAPVLSDAEGRFALEVPAGRWAALRAWHQDYQPADRYFAPGPRDPDDLIEVVLERGAPVSVLVLTPAREPVAGQEVTAELEHEHEEGWTWSDPVDRQTTGADGRARLGAVGEGTVVVEVDHRSYAPAKREAEVRGLEPVEVEVVLEDGGAIEGTVLDPGGEPAPGARVRRFGDENRVATTDERGRYRLRAVVGDVYLMAEKEGFGPGRFGEALGWGEGVPVKVADGATVRGIDIVLNLASWVRGRIVDDEDAAVAGMQLVAGGRKVETDAEGRFAAGPFGFACPTQVSVYSGSAEFHLPPVEGRKVDPGADLDLGDVRVTRRAAVKGVVYDVDGRPAAKAFVWGKGQSNASTGPDGSFELKGLDSGENAISAQVSGKARKLSRPRKVTLEPGATVEGIELRLEETFTIEGRVVTPGGRPRKGVSLVLTDPGAEPPFQWGAQGVRGATTERDGTFRFVNLFAGDYVLGIARWEDRKLDFVRPPEPQAVAAGARDVELVAPAAGGTVQGRVLSKRSGRPVTKFRASLIRYEMFLPQDWDLRSVESDDGTFREDLPKEGIYAVEVKAKGHATLRTKPVPVPKGEVVDVGEIRLGEAGAVHGTVRDHAGAPVPFTRIHVLNAQFQTNWDAPYTDMDGGYEVADLAPGRYNLFAVSPRHPLAVLRAIEVGEGARVRVDVAFAASAPLVIRVVDEGSRPVAGAKLVWTFEALRPIDSSMVGEYEPPGYGSNQSDAMGVIRKPCFPAGEVDLKVTAEGFEPVATKVELEPAVPREIEIRLERKR